MVVQEIITGPGLKQIGSICHVMDEAESASAIAWFRELRTAPIYFGSASVVEPVSDPETELLCDSFFHAIKYKGLCELELKRDGRDGRIKLIEANPRYSVTADAAPYAGVDLGWLHYLDLVGEPVEEVRWHGKHFHHIVLRRDVNCFRSSYLKAKLTNWSGIAQSYRSAVFFDFDLQDWRLTIETSTYLLKVLFYPAYRRVFPKRG